MLKQNDFVYAKKDLINQDLIIDKNEIGIVTSVYEDFALVDFVAKNNKTNVKYDFIQKFNPLEVGDLFESKVCNICHKLLDINEFSKNQNAKNNRPVRRPSCKCCRIKIDGVNVKGSDKESFLSIKPIFTKFTCPVCNKTTIPNLTSKIVLDHNHNDGVIRGWICDSCNTGLGRFKDDIMLLKNAISYLEGNDKK